MSNYPPEDFGDVHWDRTQGALIDFIYESLDLAFTWLGTADIGVRDDPKGCEMALTKVGAALNAVRRLAARIDSPLVKREIDTRADQLEAAIRTF